MKRIIYKKWISRTPERYISPDESTVQRCEVEHLNGRELYKSNTRTINISPRRAPFNYSQTQKNHTVKARRNFGKGSERKSLFYKSPERLIIIFRFLAKRRTEITTQHHFRERTTRYYLTEKIIQLHQAATTGTDSRIPLINHALEIFLPFTIGFLWPLVSGGALRRSARGCPSQLWTPR